MNPRHKELLNKIEDLWKTNTTSPGHHPLVRDRLEQQSAAKDDETVESHNRCGTKQNSFNLNAWIYEFMKQQED